MPDCGAGSTQLGGVTVLSVKVLSVSGVTAAPAGETASSKNAIATSNATGPRAYDCFDLRAMRSPLSWGDHRAFDQRLHGNQQDSLKVVSGHSDAELGISNRSGFCVANVLLVEDDKDIMDLMAFRLTSYGHTVCPAQTSEHALDAIEDGFVPDIIVLDVGLPGLDGFDLLAQLRAKNPLGGRMLPAVFVSGYTDAEHVVQGRALGAVYLQKPVEMASLQRAITNACAA